MKLLRLRPARPEQHVNVVRDLDSLASDNVGFRFGGKTHILRSIGVGELLQVYEAFGTVFKTAKDSKSTSGDVIDAYTELFSSLCDTITRKEVEQMTQAQAAALFQLVLDTVTGSAQAEGLKKNLTPDLA